MSGTVQSKVYFEQGGDRMVVKEGGTIQIGTTATPASTALIGAGSSSYPVTTATADVKHIALYLQSSATSGDNRGMYLWYYLTSTGGGEALRANTYVTGANGTCHGAHLGLELATGGSVSGLGAAVRATLKLAADQNPTGTICGGMSELYFDGAGSSSADITTATHSVHRFVIGGDATAKAKVTNVFSFVGMNSTCLKSGTVGGTVKGLRCLFDGTVMYLQAGTTCS